jgi:hypothetical protein
MQICFSRKRRGFAFGKEFIGLQEYNMKVFASIALSTYYLLVSMGILVNIHYCGGKVKSVEVYAPAKACCCPSGTGDMTGCCGNESFFYQFDEDQVSTQVVQKTSEDEPVPTIFIDVHSAIADLALSHQADGPDLSLPPPDPGPRWLRYCSLIYYG